jgi:tripartite-type tricarboxylate transporter receptor subunit TctC
MKEVMAMPDVKARLGKIGAVPFGNSASEYSVQINQEIARMKVLVRERKISLED